jgi:D-alanyl-D-alanine-carboxypeptidase/D-alanyl-D-alanine-endopeptidase
MHSTAIMLSPELKSRLAGGHTSLYESTPNWDFTEVFAGAGALCSTANDMLSFLGAQFADTNSELSRAMAATVSTRKSAGAGMEIGLGWLIKLKKGSEIIWHNGGTGGYRTFAGFDPKARTGVVVLTNISTQAGVDDIGFHFLDPESALLPNDSPLLRPPWEPMEITLESNALDLYAGKYQLPSIGIVTVTREGSRLFLQLAGQPRLEFFAKNEREFFCKVEEAKIIFESDAKGPATALILHQGGQDFRAARIAK